MANLVDRLYDGDVCSIAENSCRNRYLMEEAAHEIGRLETAIEAAVAAIDAMLPAIFDAEHFTFEDKIKALQAVQAYRDAAAWKIKQEQAAFESA